ncbi:MAG: MOSC domain-containing protein, partial [Gammaproteobacteria bacterium]|nr:MOSC domain-containing protein [Gammaproteobacteria bacterium]
YPCKSLRGISLDSVLLEARGLQDDRRWMVVDSNGEFITQRQQPRMALVDVQLTDEGLLISLAESEPVCASRGGGNVFQVKVWNDWVEAESCGREVDEWLSDFLTQPCRVVYMADHVQRPVDPVYAEAGKQVSFADGFPLLLISEASLEALNEKLEQPVSMAHFRPNVVVTGCEAFAEDQWRQLKIDEVELCVVKPCSRCVITSIDPNSAEKHPQQQPLRTLLTFRKQGKEVCFGQNIIPSKMGVLSLSQKVTVVEKAQ